MNTLGRPYFEIDSPNCPAGLSEHIYRQTRHAWPLRSKPHVRSRAFDDSSSLPSIGFPRAQRRGVRFEVARQIK